MLKTYLSVLLGSINVALSSAVRSVSERFHIRPRCNQHHHIPIIAPDPLIERVRTGLQPPQADWLTGQHKPDPGLHTQCPG